jgi:hypothetical protein
MPRLNECNLAVGPLQRSEHAVNAVTGIAENFFDALSMESLDEEIANRL